MKKKPGITICLIIAAVSCLLIVFALIFFRSPKTELELDVSVFDGQFCALIFYAEHLHLFEEERLKINYTYFDSGVSAVENLVADQADLATGAEFVAVNYIQKNPELRILSTIATGDVSDIIYKKDVDLYSSNKKRIGIKLLSQADFFFQRFLVYNDLSPESFEIIDTNPSDMLEKLKNDELDGVVVWDPIAYEIKTTLKEEVKDESVQAGQELYFLLLSNASVIEEKEEAIQRFLQVIVKAEELSEKKPDDFRSFLKERLRLTDEELEDTVDDVLFSVSLSQALLEAMEAEARWSIMKGTFTGQTLPNYLDFIKPNYLLEIEPDRVFLYR